MKGSSLVGLRGRGIRSVSGWGPSDGLGPTLLVPLWSVSYSGPGERRSRYGFSRYWEPPLGITGLPYTVRKDRKQG